MGDWEFWIGPSIAAVIALRLRPIYLIGLGAAAYLAFYVSFSTSFSLYGECNPCSTRAETLFWINGILFTMAPTLLLLTVPKLLWTAWRQRPSSINEHDGVESRMG